MRFQPTLLGTLLVCSLSGGSALAEDAYVDLISPSTCTPNAGRLTQCTIAPRTLQGTPFETAVPMRTVVKRNMSGNCSTQYPLEVTFTPPGEPAVRYTYISQAETVIRGLNRPLLTSMEMTDTSPWTRYAAVNETCRISLDILWNQVDVDTAEQAQAILAPLETALATEQANLANLEALLDYSTLFDFTAAVFANFEQQLTNSTMQFLRAQANAASSVVMEFTSNCNPRDAQGNLIVTPQERVLLANYLYSLGTLGSNDDWKNPDGTPKTLADFFGEEDGARELFLKLSTRSDEGATEEYQTAVNQARGRVLAAQHKVNVAKAQLAQWLPAPTP